jgi:hypothetical protein
MFSLQWKCPHCSREETFTLTGVAEYLAKEQIPVGAVSTQRATVIMREGHQTVRAHGMASCPKCNGPILIWFECASDALRRIGTSAKDWVWRYDGPPPRILGVYPKGEEPDDSPHFPEALRKVFVELQEDIRMKRTAPRLVMGCRSVMEVALKALGYDDKKDALSGRIDKARDDGVLTESMRAWAHRIRLDGNEAAHELQATDEEAREFVDFLRLFMEVAFVLPTRIPKK